ncbi:MAG: hypothetical protein HY756_09760 [Nitrospirae bacterium]|nr:hypothetical protein [Nitrospirota bacterium]
MYIRKTKRQYSGKTYTNYLLVESIYTSKGPRQKTICSLGDLSPRPAREWLKLAHKIEDALIGQEGLLQETDHEAKKIIDKVKKRLNKAEAATKGDDEVISVQIDKVETALHREAGPVHVGYQFWKRLGLNETLDNVGLSGRAQTLTCTMALNRLIFP